MSFIRRRATLSQSNRNPPSAATSLPALLAACDSPRTLRRIHARIVTKGAEQDTFLITLLVGLCNSYRDLPYALSTFDRVRRPTIFLWNSILKGYSDNSPLLDTLLAFKRMKRSPTAPDRCTFPSLLKACAGVAALREGMSLHCAIVRAGVGSDVFVQTGLVDLYGKCGEVGRARKVFDLMSEHNVVSWTALMVAYLNYGDLEAARMVFDDMPRRNVPAWNAMIDGYAKCGDLTSAGQLFDEMPEKNVVSFTSLIVGYAKSGDMSSARYLFDQSCDRDAVSWSALISGYEQNGQPIEAVKIFFEMCEKNIKSDEFVLVSLMSACSQLSDKALSEWVETYLAQSGLNLDRVHVVSALVDMNAKCGNLDRALELFWKMPKRNLVVYCSIMQGLLIHGSGAKAVELFSQMLEEGLVPDEVAFTVVLTACSHAGLTEEGRQYFLSMKDYGLTPSEDHYACKVHLLGQAGLLKEAYDLLKCTPVEFHAGAWGALLGACWRHGNVELGEKVASQLFEIEPTNGGNYVLLSNIYAAADQWGKLSELRNQMRERGIKKIPGCSWVSASRLEYLSLQFPVSS